MKDASIITSTFLVARVRNIPKAIVIVYSLYNYSLGEQYARHATST
jgi:hypothetical protein